MNYKNTIYLISFLLIGLYSLIMFVFELYQDQLFISHILTKDIYLQNVFYSILAGIVLTLTTLYIANRIEKKIKEEKEKEKRFNYRLEMINNFYTILQEKKGIKNTSAVSLEFIAKQLGAHSGLIYLANYKNLQLQLLNIYNAELSKVSRITNIYKGLCGEAFSTRKIKLYFKKGVTYIAIPLVHNKKTVGVMELKFFKKIDQLNLDKREKTLIQIIANNLLKELEQDKNEKYIELIDKYVLISSTNKEGEITYASEALCKETGYSKEELLGDTHRKLRDPSVPNSFYKDLWTTVLLGKRWEGEMPNIKKDGSRYWAQTSIVPKYDFYNNITGFDAIRVDITDKKLIEKISITDGLTKLYNRRYFDQMFKQQLSLASRVSRKLVFCLLDIDHFKQYNDTYGHQMGDEALKKVASALKLSLKRETDMVFRLGGEEFGALFFVQKDLDAISTARKVREKIENLKLEHKKNSASPYVTVSMGLYLYKGGRDIKPEHIYKLCDDLLYKAKKKGRNQIVSNLDPTSKP